MASLVMATVYLCLLTILLTSVQSVRDFTLAAHKPENPEKRELSEKRSLVNGLISYVRKSGYPTFSGYLDDYVPVANYVSGNNYPPGTNYPPGANYLSGTNYGTRNQLLPTLKYIASPPSSRLLLVPKYIIPTVPTIKRTLSRAGLPNIIGYGLQLVANPAPDQAEFTDGTSANGVLATKTDGTLNNQATLILYLATLNDQLYPKYQRSILPANLVGSEVDTDCCLVAGTSCSMAPDKCCTGHVCRTISNSVQICVDPSYVSANGVAKRNAVTTADNAKH